MMYYDALYNLFAPLKNCILLMLIMNYYEFTITYVTCTSNVEFKSIEKRKLYEYFLFRKSFCYKNFPFIHTNFYLSPSTTTTCFNTIT